MTSIKLIPAVMKLMTGSVVLPILGAVPDGCIVLFSGLGPNAEEELAVGIGAVQVDGALVVVRGRESRPHGEGEQFKWFAWRINRPQ